MSRNLKTNTTTIEPARYTRLETEPDRRHNYSHMRSPKPQLTIDQVTPELAAQIVKNFVLPMFEHSKFKKSKGTIYSDLKLTEVLQESLEDLKGRFNFIEHSLLTVTQEKQLLTKELKQQKIKNSKSSQKISLLRQQLLL